MKITVTESIFRDRFERMGRKNQFSYDGLTQLYNYLTDTEGDWELELDVIAICCDFTEFENLLELQKEYPDIETMEELQNKTIVIPINDESFIIQNY